jgi:hypothetical protein
LAKDTGNKTKNGKCPQGIKIAYLSRDRNLCRGRFAGTYIIGRFWRVIGEDLMGGSQPGIPFFPS